LFDFINQYLSLILAMVFLAPVVTGHGYFYDMSLPKYQTAYLRWWSWAMKTIGFATALVVVALMPIMTYALFANWNSDPDTTGLNGLFLGFSLGTFAVALGHIIGFPYSLYRGLQTRRV
jgi:hypothetical protein